ncbi:cryptochrome/photolyase family protein [Microbacterium excoecariae]|uniref:cryptochrome/photolyase family protein n=1 Tax=Microbacterium excoecariae TaxID=2715210 RepID=UPI00140B6C2A|nr:deoxyribodipyrimidine photo-lyase [Microbacterium excoecariae]NHI16561.1 deoxyribodipyrimidine photo-lyase [Microbacterium excoecariae]
MASVVWFRDDLRLADHAALAAAAEDDDGLIALYVLDEESDETRPLGGAAKWWLHGSLERLDAALRERGGALVLRRGRAEEVVPAVVRAAGATRVFWNRRYGAEREIDARLKEALRGDGIEARSFPGSLLFEPWTIATKSGGPYRVYSPFWRACLEAPEPARPLPAPATLAAADAHPESDDLAEWKLRPTSPDWATGIAERWTPGEDAARAALEDFLGGAVARYDAGRDVPSEDAVSGLSPYLRWGEISPRTVWHEAWRSGADVGTFLSELGWREFAWHTAFHHPDLHTRGLNARFDAFPWEDPDPADLAAWQQGTTGYPLVDAGMRELWQSGSMHNRVRMVAASFLTKNMLVDWRVGERWFWDTLVDADAASNPFNWQWVAGCGADAAPYFRIFNPRTQEQKFDPEGRYVKEWAPDSLLTPELVDLKASRERALAAYDTI